MLQIRADVRDGVCVFRLDGTLTTVEVPYLKTEVRAALEKGCVDIVLDLAGTEFVDSAGLGAFVALHKAALVGGGALRIASPRPGVRALFDLTRLHRVLTIDAPDVPSGEAAAP